MNPREKIKKEQEKENDQKKNGEQITCDFDNNYGDQWIFDTADGRADDHSCNT